MAEEVLITIIWTYEAKTLFLVPVLANACFGHGLYFEP